MGAKPDKRTRATVEVTNATNADHQQTQAKLILKLGPPPASEQTTSLKLKDALGNEVKGRLDNWRYGSDARLLLDMLVKSINICNKYSLYNGDGEWKAVVQAVSRALTGKCEKEHDKLIEVTRGWEQQEQTNTRK